MVLRDQHPRITSPLIVNNTCSVSLSIGDMDGFRVMHYGNWTDFGKWVAMEVGTG